MNAVGYIVGLWSQKDFEKSCKHFESYTYTTQYTQEVILLPIKNNGSDQVDQGAVEILKQVSLDYFRAEPSILPPFGSSRLSWKVDGPRGFQTKINGVKVEKASSQTIEPESTQTYRLYANVRNASNFLGSVTVNVNLDQCISHANSTIDEILEAKLKDAINARNDVYFPIVEVKDPNNPSKFRRVLATPSVIITLGQIYVHLILRARKDLFPDPWVDIELRFGVMVVNDSESNFFNRRVIPANEKIDVRISVPWWVWLLPVPGPLALSIALDFAKQDTIKEMHKTITELVNGIAVILRNDQPPLPQGMEEHSARIYFIDGIGVVEVTYCPYGVVSSTDIQ